MSVENKMKGFKREYTPNKLKALGLNPINRILRGEGFYISYNPSIVDYGCVTTAVVDNNMNRFVILKGDWRERLSDVVDQGYEACLSFCKENETELHEVSDRIYGKTDFEIMMEKNGY